MEQVKKIERLFDILDLVDITRAKVELAEEWLDENSSDYCYEMLHELFDGSQEVDPDIEEKMMDYWYESLRPNVSIYQVYLNELEDRINSNWNRFEKDEFDCLELHLLPVTGDNPQVRVKITCDPDAILRQGMSAWGEFDYGQHDEDDKNSLKEPYYILREFLHYYEACEGKPRLKTSFDWDTIYCAPSLEQMRTKLQEILNESGTAS